MYSRLVEDIHNKCLKYRRLDIIIESYEFSNYWTRNPDRQEEIIQLVRDLKTKEIRKMILRGTEIENMTLRELRAEASNKHMKYYTTLDCEALRAELIKVRDKENGKR